MSHLLTTSPDQAESLRQNVHFHVLLPVWGKWESNVNVDPATVEQASIILAQLPDADDIGDLLDLLR